MCVYVCGKYLCKNNNNICRVRRVGDRGRRSINVKRANRPTFRRGMSDGRRLHMQVGEDLRSTIRAPVRRSFTVKPDLTDTSSPGGLQNDNKIKAKR